MWFRTLQWAWFFFVPMFLFMEKHYINLRASSTYDWQLSLNILDTCIHNVLHLFLFIGANFKAGLKFQLSQFYVVNCDCMLGSIPDKILRVKYFKWFVLVFFPVATVEWLFSLFLWYNYGRKRYIRTYKFNESNKSWEGL
jgi:hypothetical protein